MSVRRAASHVPPAERAALVSLIRSSSRHVDPEHLMEEFAGLARAAGAEVVIRVSQERRAPDSSTFIGRGKAELLAVSCAEANVNLVLVDNELTPAQSTNLEKAVGRRVLDRTALILDIFARRARTREGQLQVELAQLEYRLPRLAGSSTDLSRLGGGIGTRGPGETKLETDRRRIRMRIAAIKRDISDVERRRTYLRARRHRADVPVVALVGYTNAGKTTLFNRLTGQSALASDALFVTLDPLVRRVKLADGRQILVSDTVGFIERLPHQLVAAFRATLEEVAGADLLLHVIDAAAPDRDRRIAAVRAVLSEIGADAVPVIDVFNKADLIDPSDAAHIASRQPAALAISAARGTGKAELIAAVAGQLKMEVARVRLQLDGRREDDRRLIADLYRHARVISHEVSGNRVSVEADVPPRLRKRTARVEVPA